MTKAKNEIGRSMSLTTRITLWYVAFLLIISLILTVVLLRSYDQRINGAAASRLHRVVADVGNAIESAGEDFVLNKNIYYYTKDVYLSVYDSDGELVTGRLPHGIGEFPPINTDHMQIIESDDGSEWHIYDAELVVDNRDLTIRGMMNTVTIESRRRYGFRVFALLIPIILLVASVGGYLITRRALAPVRGIIKTTDDISGEGELSLRIPLGKSHDEIYDLSKSFNDMFGRIEELVQREKQFTADVSHELRTPLAIIQAQSEFAMEDEEYAPEAVKVINKESRKMTALISNLLMMARSDAGRMEPELLDVDISTMVEEIVDIEENAAEESGQTIERDIEKGIIAKTDPEMLSRIVLNLLDNAIKYGKGEGGRIRVSLHEARGEAVLKVSDDGDGIREEDRDKIWERFYQTDKAGSGENSTGLGLAIVEALSKNIGGHVSLRSSEESELGGATFELRIPITSKDEGRQRA